MPYDEIFSAFYLIVDKDFFKLDKEIAYEYMRQWLHNAISEANIRELFSSISLKDEVEEVIYTLKNPSDNYHDDMFIKNILSSYMKIAWITLNVDTGVNMAIAVGGSYEKKIMDHYKDNIERIKILKRELSKMIKDYNSTNNNYVGGMI